MLKVYIAAPYTSNPEENTLNVLQVADKLLEKGFIPIVPHLSHYWDLLFPKNYTIWIMIGLALLEGCDVVLRLPGLSKGADIETEYAKRLGIPIILMGDDFDSAVNDIKCHKETLFSKAHSVCVQRSEEYNQGTVKRDDYWLYGNKSIIHEMWKKVLRLVSLEESGQLKDKGNDSLVDIVNYANFLWDKLQQ